MLKLGTTSLTLVDMPREANIDPQHNPEADFKEISNTLGSSIVRGTGKTREVYSIPYNRLELSEFALLKTYCIPFTYQIWHGQILNADEEIIFDDRCWVSISDIKFEDNFQRVNCKLVVKQTF